MTTPARAAILLGSNHEPRRNLRHAVARLARFGRIVAVSPVYQSADATASSDSNGMDPDSEAAAQPATGAPGPSAPPYLNAAVLLETWLAAPDLKFQVLRTIEADLGRVRLSAAGDLPAGDLPVGDLPVGDHSAGDFPAGDLPAGSHASDAAGSPAANAPALIPIDLDLALYDDLVVDDPVLGLRLPDPAILVHRHAAQPLADLLPELRHPVDGRDLARIAADLAAEAPPPPAVLGEGDGGRGRATMQSDEISPSAGIVPDLIPVPDLDLSPRPMRPKDPRARAIETFFQGDRLVQIPAAPAALRYVLEGLVERFEARRDYSEAEVNRLLGLAHEDHATLRRALVDLGLMRRDGGVYRRTG